MPGSTYKIAILLDPDLHRLLKELAIEKEFTITGLLGVIVDGYLRDYYSDEPSDLFKSFLEKKKLEHLN